MATRNSSAQPADRQESHQFQFRGIHLPAQVVTMLANRQINRSELIILIMVESLVQHGGPGCFASNGYFADIVGTHKVNVSQMIGKLRGSGLLKVTDCQGQRFLETAWSRLSNGLTPLVENTKGGLVENTNHNKDRKKKVPSVSRSARKRVGTTLEAHHLSWADRLHKVITTGLNVRRAWRRSKWAQELRILESETSTQRVERALAWFENNYRTFTVESASGFRRDFVHLEKRIRTSPNSPDDKPHKDTGVVLEKLSHLKWPTVARDKLPRAISIGLKNLERLTNAFRTAPPEVRREFKVLIEAINYEIGRDTTFVAEFYEKVHREKAGWKDWRGHLPELSFKVGSGLDLICRSVSAETCRDENRWNKLMEKIDL